MCYPGPYEIFQRVQLSFSEERYEARGEMEEAPTSRDISDAFAGRLRWD